MTTRLVRTLSQHVGLPPGDIERIIATAPRRYKEFKIKKRNGRGLRDIAQPSRELKALQRCVIDALAPLLPLHECAHGYVTGRGIKSNAERHRNGRFVLKMDIADFFPSIRPADFREHLRAFLPEQFDEVEVKQLELILFWLKKGERTLRMCIGAPSSPAVSNTIMYRVDQLIQELCDAQAVMYTRYADDLVFSCDTEGVLGEIEKQVTSLVNGSKHPRLRINLEKSVHLSRKQRRTITGVNITPLGDLSIGRQRKRLIRAMISHHVHGTLDREGQNELIGLLGFANDIEPLFAERMWLKLRSAPDLIRSSRKECRIAEILTSQGTGTP